MVSDTQIARGVTRRCHINYSFQLAARVLLYASFHRQDNTYHYLCYTSRGALAWPRNSSMGSPWRINRTTHGTMSERSYHGATHQSKSHVIYPRFSLEIKIITFPSFCSSLTDFLQMFVPSYRCWSVKAGVYETCYILIDL